MLLTKVNARYRRIVGGLPIWLIVACLSVYGLIEVGKRAEKFEKTQIDLRTLLEQLRSGLAGGEGGGTDEAAARRRAVCAQYWKDGAVIADADELFAPMRPALHQWQESMTIACQVQEESGIEFRAKVRQAIDELGRALDTFRAESHERQEQKTRWEWLGLLALFGLSAAGTAYGLWSLWNSIRATYLVGQRTIPGDPESRGSWVRAAYESSTEGILIMEAGGEIRFANAAAERLLGYGQGELSGQGVGEVADLVVPMKQVGGAAEPSLGTDRIEGKGKSRRRLTASNRAHRVNGQTIAVIPEAIENKGQFEESNRGDRGTGRATESAFRESMQLLKKEMMCWGALDRLAVADSATNDTVRADLNIVRRATARAAFLVEEALLEKAGRPSVPAESGFQSLIIATANRLRALLDEEVEVSLGAGYADVGVLADLTAVENAVVSLVLHSLRLGNAAQRVTLQPTATGSIELSVLAIDGALPQWKRVEGAEGLPRYAERLRSEGATIEMDVSDSGCRFRIALRPVAVRDTVNLRQKD